MLIKEAHILFNQGLNKISSHQGEIFLSEEIDSYLYRGMVSVIEEYVRQFYQKLDKPSEDISQLIVSNYKISTNYTNTNSIIHNPKGDYNICYFLLPNNHIYTVNIKPYMQYGKLCDTVVIDNSSTRIEYISVVPFNYELIGNKTDGFDFIVTMDLGGTNEVLFDLSNYGNYDTLITNENNKFLIINLLLEEINLKNRDSLSTNTIFTHPVNPANDYTNLKIKAYWERYREYYYPNSFIFVSSDQAYSENNFIEIKIDSASATAYSGTDTNSSYYIVPEEKSRGLFYTKTLPNKTIAGQTYNDLSVARIIDSTKINEFLFNPINKPTKERPLAEVGDDRFWLYSPENSVINDIYLDYIRYPRVPNLSLNWNLEVTGTLAQDCVNRAVELAMGEIVDQGIQLKLQTNQLEK